ncbi:hypothetical protein EAG08_01735 [Chryseobacterium sp. 3008163]|nr:hypothetical protein EAG08_01735 [Chryseobacterium sp. 3008163]
MRTSPEMHEKLFMASVESKTKLNAIINDAFDVYFSTEKKKESTFDMATPPDRWSVIGNNKHAWLKSDSSKIPTEKVYVVFDARDDNSYTVLSTGDLDIHKRNEFDIPSWKSIMDKMRKDRMEKKNRKILMLLPKNPIQIIGQK